MITTDLNENDKLVITQEFYDHLKNDRGWDDWALGCWPVGSLAAIEEYNATRNTYVAHQIGNIWSTGGIPVDIARRMRAAYLALTPDDAGGKG